MKIKVIFLVSLILILSFGYAFAQTDSSSGSGGGGSGSDTSVPSSSGGGGGGGVISEPSTVGSGGSGSGSTGSGSTTSVPSSGGGGGCSDSDGGIDYYRKGTVKYTNGESNTDYCKDEKTLVEYSCGRTKCTTTDVCLEPTEPIIPMPYIYISYKTESISSLIDGEMQTATIGGFSKTIEEGTHKLLFKKDGYKDCEKSINFEKGKLILIFVALQSIDSSEACLVDIKIEDNVGFGGGASACYGATKCETIDTKRIYSCEGSCNDGTCIASTEPHSPPVVYSKRCEHVWDSSPYLGQEVKITVSISDSTGESDSDSVSINVLDAVASGSGGGRYMDGKSLDIQINSPHQSNVGAGAVKISASSMGPNSLGQMSVAFESGNTGGAFPISEKNCVMSVSGGGGEPGPLIDTCEKYYTCEDGIEVQYCFIHKSYNEDGEVIGGGCGCKSEPEKLCKKESESEIGDDDNSDESNENEEVKKIPEAGEDAPFICDGCVLDDKCVFVGFRSSGKYCDLNSEFVKQQSSEKSCENNFECSSNICIDNKCISQGLFSKILNWFKKLFGG